MTTDAATFEAHRPALRAHAYRMLGDVGLAEDVVQDAWIRWARRTSVVLAPKPFLLKVVTRLCLNHLGSARSRREETRGIRLPEPLDLPAPDVDEVDTLDRVSMAFLVVLQRLTAAERAVLLLHDVFDFSHAQVGAAIGRTEAACRQLLVRARAHVARERRVLPVSQAEHRRLLAAFVAAATSGDSAALRALLADDAALLVDAGPRGGRFGPMRELPGPVVGAAKIAALVAAVAAKGTAGVDIVLRDLNGQPAAVLMRDSAPVTAILLSTASGRIRHIFMQADPARLTRLGTGREPTGTRPPRATTSRVNRTRRAGQS